MKTDIPFKTTPEEQKNLKFFEVEMLSSGVDSKFVDDIIVLGAYDQGIYNLIEIWFYSKSTRNETIIELKKSLGDYKKFPDYFDVIKKDYGLIKNG